jgi:hypothetical protein
MIYFIWLVHLDELPQRTQIFTRSAIRWSETKTNFQIELPSRKNLLASLYERNTWHKANTDLKTSRVALKEKK